MMYKFFFYFSFCLLAPLRGVKGAKNKKKINTPLFKERKEPPLGGSKRKKNLPPLIKKKEKGNGVKRRSKNGKMTKIPFNWFFLFFLAPIRPLGGRGHKKKNKKNRWISDLKKGCVTGALCFRGILDGKVLFYAGFRCPASYPLEKDESVGIAHFLILKNDRMQDRGFLGVFLNEKHWYHSLFRLLHRTLYLGRKKRRYFRVKVRCKKRNIEVFFYSIILGKKRSF